LPYLQAKIEAQMHSTESPPRHDEYPERSAEASSSNRVYRLRPGTAYRPSGSTNAQFRSDRPSISRRLTRKLARFFLAVLIGVGGTLAWQYYGGEMVRAWAPSLGWLLPASPPGPAVTSTELQQQLKPMAIDLALVRRSEEQLAANQDQLARKQDQMAQAIATLQAAEQDLSQKMSAPPSPPPAPKPVHVSPKQLQPPAQ
jgi:uncharacterized iron-regulated membrane protein